MNWHDLLKGLPVNNAHHYHVALRVWQHFSVLILDVESLSMCLYEYFILYHAELPSNKSSSTQDRGDTFQSRLMVVGHAAATNEGMEERKETVEEAPMEIDPESAVTEQNCQYNSSSGVQVVQSSSADGGTQALVTSQTSRQLWRERE